MNRRASKRILTMATSTALAVAALAGCGGDGNEAPSAPRADDSAAQALVTLARDMRTDVEEDGCSDEERASAERFIDRARGVRGSLVRPEVRALEQAVGANCADDTTTQPQTTGTSPPDGSDGEQQPQDEGGSGGVPSAPPEGGDPGKQSDPCGPDAPPEC